MQQPLYRIVFALLHALFLLQPVLSLPMVLVRRVHAGHLTPIDYYPGQRIKGGFTYSTWDDVSQGTTLTHAEVDARAREAYQIIVDNYQGPMQKTLVLAALYVPSRNKIYYASQPVGAGYRWYTACQGHYDLTQGTNIGGRWPGELKHQQNLHAEGHAIFKALLEPNPDFRGSYVGVYGHFSVGYAHKIPPCQAGGSGLTNCRHLLTTYGIAF